VEMCFLFNIKGLGPKVMGLTTTLYKYIKSVMQKFTLKTF